MSANLTLFIIISFTNVFLHILRTLLVVKSGKAIASFMNCICYTFSAVVVKFISESNLTVAMIVAASTNFLGCYAAMLVFENIKRFKKINYEDA